MTDLSQPSKFNELAHAGFWRVLPKDTDPTETKEWLDALTAVLEEVGPERATYLLRKLLDHARAKRVPLPPVLNTPYCNTISLAEQPQFPGNLEVEARLSALVRWNALAMVVRANRDNPELGGHIATYSSAADLFDVGFNHFFRAGQEGDVVFFQPHSAPGVYARAYLEGRLSEEQLANYRRETAGKGLSSYCHPWLMPSFWQFPTGSMGLGPITAIYQARFMRYLEDRGVLKTTGRKVWCFPGDGEMDEPESIAGLAVAAREGLDNLIFVVNCNLQRLDGPVRGNGSIIQELEGLFAGAGWNVIKLMWGSDWDSLFLRDTEGILLKRLHETVDGEFQKYAATDGQFNREHFFNKYPELQALVAHLSNEDIDRLKRGGHDSVKIYAAYHAAMAHAGRPTVILAQTKKGYGMGHWGQGKMTTHQQKKLDDEALRAFRDRFSVPISDEDVSALRFFKPAGDSAEMKYMHARRQALGGYMPERKGKAESFSVPALASFAKLLEGTGERDQSTTMVFVQMLSQILRDKNFGKHIVPIVADEARTFGMQSLFRQVAIYSPFGQLYEPEDRDELLYYKEAKDGQILEEGITEAGAISSWIAAATSYSTHGVPMLPFYIFYSCFGFQRIGDLIWSAADSRARGFLLGATAGRTTLSGEGLQHEDGSSHLLFSTVPNCVAYDPSFGYEVATIIQDGMRRMLEAQEDVFYYVTVMNENYVHPTMPEGAREGILRGMYCVREARGARREASVQLLGSGTILREVLAAAELLEKDWNVPASVWSVTSFTELRRDGLAAERWNRLHPGEKSRETWVEQCLDKTIGPVIASTDYMRTVPDLIRTWVPRRYVTLGTDGFGRSDSRAALRNFFEVDRHHVVTAALDALAGEGSADRKLVKQAIEKYALNTEAPNPWDV
ncbi:MAG: alpha-ketoglutarate dehydrogenase [Betaproteobacteria bacterium]|nr:alpha-ketoglutarate dehydrogenase [Betaproteobacteria bacterium]